MADTHDTLARLRAADIPLERDLFVRSMIRELAGTLQDVVGLGEAEGFISLVGQRIGDQLDGEYRRALGAERLEREEVAAVLVDLKRRIQGGFSIVSQDDDAIVLTNDACPFAEKVADRPALCMMTSNVFGTIAAENLGWAKVELAETIADGSPRCLVTVHLRRTTAADAAAGREFVRG